MHFVQGALSFETLSGKNTTLSVLHLEVRCVFCGFILGVSQCYSPICSLLPLLCCCRHSRSHSSGFEPVLETTPRPQLTSKGRSVHYGVHALDTEGHMVDGLFCCATLTGRTGGHTSSLQARAETSDTGAEAVKPDRDCTWKGYSERGTSVSGMKARSV